jgi:eukaryotic-like serine/threonine-protein kinase
MTQPSQNDDDADPRIGRVLDGKFRIEALIGAGGMGRVYRATHLSLGEPVAVKFLLAELARSATTRERFRREAQALARLRHPGIVSVLDFGEANDELYMAMELVSGSVLADLIHPQGPELSLLRLGDVFSQILSVLEMAHREGVVHRDLKPENVMLVENKDRRDLVKILDFGLALVNDPKKVAERLTETGTVHGTPHYMSPEQCKGIEVGAPTDVYAVGCMLFEAISGVPPFDAEEMAGLMAQQMFVEPPPLASVGQKRTVSVGLEKVVRSALAKAAAERPTAGELRDALAAAIAGTDPDAMIARSADERIAAAGLSREDRALTGVGRKGEAQASGSGVVPRVCVWADGSAPSRDLRDSLSVNGLRVTMWEQATPPPRDVNGDPVAAVLVATWADGATRLTQLRSAGDARPVLCVGAESARDVAELIRAGASDVTLRGATQDDVAKKTKRAVKRGR